MNNKFSRKINLENNVIDEVQDTHPTVSNTDNTNINKDTIQYKKLINNKKLNKGYHKMYFDIEDSNKRQLQLLKIVEDRLYGDIINDALKEYLNKKLH